MAETEHWEMKNIDRETAEMMSRVGEWVGERRCKEMEDKGFQGRGKAERQSAGFDGNGGEEKKQKDNPD